MSDNYDHYVVSTKCTSRQKTICVVLVAALFGFGAYVCYSVITTDAYWFVFRTTRHANVFGVVFFLVCYLSGLMIIAQIQSYCTVYEGHVMGKTVAKFGFFRGSGLTSFDLKYDEIENVFEENQTIIIHTRYTSLKVLAASNRATALHEIRARIGHDS